MLHAKYQPNWHSGSGEEVISTLFIIYGHGGHLESRIMTFLSYSCITIKYKPNMKFHSDWLSTFIGNVI